MYPYEGMFLLDPVRHTADPEETEKSVTKLIEKHGGEIAQSERWDDRRLAYEIKGHKRGIYYLTYFRMPGANVDAMRRESKITETILRQMVIRLPADIPEYLAMSASYYDKMREDQGRGMGGEEGAPPPTTPRSPEPPADDAGTSEETA